MMHQTAVSQSHTSPHSRNGGIAREGAPQVVPTFVDRLAGARILVNRNKTVIEEGDAADHVFRVVAGSLRMVRLLPDGRRHLSSFLMPNDLFGWTDGETYAHNVEAVADTTLIRYPRQRFEALLNSDAAASHRFLDLLCGQLAATQERLLVLGRMSATERLAAFLLGMADREAGRNTTGEIELPMNRTDIADYLGLTVETVSRALTSLRSRRIIELPTANHVVVVKRRALESLSAGDA